MSFVHSKYILSLLLVPVLVAFYWFAARERVRAMRAFASDEVSRRLLSRYSPSRFIVKSALTILAFCFGVLALLQPRWGYHWEEVSSRGVDVILALDLSKSMDAEDVAPSRLERAKRKIADFLKLAQGDRIALIGFAGKAFVQCPLTLDYDAILSFLDNMDTETISPPGTALAEAVQKAIEVLSTSDIKSRRTGALVIFSDGEDHDGNLDEEAKKAKEAGVRIYGVGVGKESGAPIPEGEGGSAGFKKDSRGELILTRLEEKSLKSLALSTGGSYVRSVPGDEDLSHIYSDIRAQVREKEAVGGRQKKEEERFQWPLLLALLCLIFETLLGDAAGEETTKEKWSMRGWHWVRRRFARKEALAALIFALLVIPHSASAGLFSSDTAQGEKAYREGKYDEALDHFLKAQVDSPDDPRLRYNLANTYYKLGRFADAEKLYGSALDSKPGDLNEKSEYNLGNSAYREKKWDEAIDHYQKALKLNSSDEEAKHNLEMAKRRKAEPPPPLQDSKDENSKPNQDKNQSHSSQAQNQPDQNQKDQSQKDNQSSDSSKKDEKTASSDQNKDQSAKSGKQDQDQQKSGQDKASQEKNASESKGQEDKGEPNPGETMSKEEAKDWLSRVKEGKNRDLGKKTQDSRLSSVEKDW